MLDDDDTLAAMIARHKAAEAPQHEDPARTLERLRSPEARLHAHHYFEAALVVRYSIENPVCRLIDKEADFTSPLHLALDEAIDAFLAFELRP